MKIHNHLGKKVIKKNNPLVSIVIPTFNEGSWLPLLLKSLSNQTFRDFEIVVADNHSTDLTRKIARDFGAIITDGGLPGRGRNVGADVAKGKILIFLDADVNLPNDFLEKSIAEFQLKRCDVATTLSSISHGKLFDRIFFAWCNFWVYVFQFFKPVAHGFNIFCTADIFHKVGGFDESLIAGEDFDFTLRAARVGKFKVLTSVTNMTSVRRFDKIGRWKMLFNLSVSTVRILFFRQKLRRSTDYDWTGYNAKSAKYKNIAKK
jgi:glycosyltransferase involved in cell wall biosynthesis